MHKNYDTFTFSLWWWYTEGAPHHSLWRHYTVGSPPRSRLSTIFTLLFCVLLLTTIFQSLYYVLRRWTFVVQDAYGYLFRVGHRPFMLNGFKQLPVAILHVACLPCNHCGQPWPWWWPNRVVTSEWVVGFSLCVSSSCGLNLYFGGVFCIWVKGVCFCFFIDQTLTRPFIRVTEKHVLPLGCIFFNWFLRSNIFLVVITSV